jgi:hypothetical protein
MFYIGDKNMAEKWDMTVIDNRIAEIGREFYRIMEHCPDLPDWSRADLFMFMHLRIYEEAMKLKKAAIAAERSRPSGGALEKEAV